ncbi:MAG: poly-beta-1,6 N-acetyl-D-glucosamine synthase [Clostridium sp.]|nr:poly-beta-1,6 N-acetyl-D-glucosamine synthase [Clostridium sp.]
MNVLNESGFFWEVIGASIFWYPFIMSLIWIAGSLIFSHYREKEEDIDVEKYDWPKISIILPCYNESATAKETIDKLSKLSYPGYEIIAVNDGSSDNTGEILEKLAEEYDNLRVINCLENKGKANALHMAAHAARYEYLICIDSDAILDDKAPYYLVRQFIKNGERVGAVTGNPRIRNRDTLISKIQLVEYASIIGLIKRTQRVLGKVMTVSGVIVAYRKKALMSVQLWDRDIITEDIAVSWKLQRKFWDIRYEPKALCWMLVPETLSGLWKQRVRWAQGGQEIVFRHFDIFKSWKQRRLWPIYIEQVTSILWSICWVVFSITIIFTAKNRQDILSFFSLGTLALSMLSFIQLFISMKHESAYDNIMKYYIWAAWYPVFYWIINAFVVIRALPKSIKSTIKGGYATWKSPDRGTVDNDDENEEAKEENKSYIVKSKQKTLKKIISLIINVVMCLYMFVVCHLFLSALIGFNDKYIGMIKIALKVTNEDIRYLMLTAVTYFAISFVILFIWKIYNFKRFEKLRRRKFPKDTTKEEMLSLNLVSPEVYDLLQSEKVIRFEKNPVRELGK